MTSNVRVDGAGEHVAIFYDKGRLKAIADGAFWSSPTPGTVSRGWGAVYPRIATRMRERGTTREGVPRGQPRDRRPFRSGGLLEELRFVFAPSLGLADCFGRQDLE